MIPMGWFSGLMCFNPLPSCEGRHSSRIWTAADKCFNPLPSCEGRLVYSPFRTSQQRFNPLPSCEGRRFRRLYGNSQRSASIHFPLAREDFIFSSKIRTEICFNPLPSCEGRQGVDRTTPSRLMLQSTSLLRGKTAIFTKNYPLLFYNLVCFHHTISYYFYSRYEFRCHLFIISSF